MLQKEDDFSFKQLFFPLTNKKAITIICIVGCVVFFNALFNGFVWDDMSYIVNNSEVHRFSLEKIFGSSYFNKDGFYRPIPALYFTILYAVFEKQAFFYHFSQVLLHIINAVLLFRLFKRFFQKEAALIFSLFFLIHPIIVESVSFIGATISPLFVFFGLSALQFLFLAKPLKALNYLCIALFLFLSIMTKEGGVLFFIITLLYAFFFHKNSLRKLVVTQLFLVPVYLFFRIALGRVYLTSFEATFFGQGSTLHDGRFVPIMALSFIERVLMIPSICWYYLKTVFYPVNLAVDQTWVITKMTLTSFYLPLLFSMLFFLLLVITAWYLYRIKSEESKPFLFFFIWFISGLGMHVQLLPLDMTVADRWFYFPFIGLLGMALVMVKEFLFHNKKITLLTLSLLILLLLSVRTMTRNANFADEITLYSHDRLVENNYEIELNLGSAYGKIGDLEKTQYHYQKSVELYPNEANYLSLGLFHEWKGDFKQAKMFYEKAAAARGFYLNPDKRLSLTAIRLSYVYLKLGEFEKARESTKKGLAQYPDEQSLWVRLAQSEYKMGNDTEALTAITKAKSFRVDEITEYTYKTILEKKPLEIK